MNPASPTDLPAWITALRKAVPEPYLRVVDDVWTNRTAFIEWPSKSFLFMPGTTREQKYHKYTVEQLAQIKAAKARADSRSNGPAVMAYLLAGGRRPKRASDRKEWSVHHIYDGQHPALDAANCTHAVLHPENFTEAAGLVAIHPIADALADEFAYFAWLLRFEAYRRFNYDPDCVFGTGAPDHRTTSADSSNAPA